MSKLGLLTLFFLVSIVLLMYSAGGFCQLSFSIMPLIQEVAVRPGATRDFTLRVITAHAEQKEMHFLVYPVDFGLEKDGRIEFFPPGSRKRSAAPWIKTDPVEFTIEPNQMKDIHVEITVPRNVSGGYYAAILVHLVPEVPPDVRIRTLRSWRMASLVELTVIGWKKPLARIGIRELKVEPSSEEIGLSFAATVENKGNVHARGEGTLTVTTKEGRRLAELPLKAGRGTVFPETVRNFSTVLDRELPSGEYFADVTFKYGDRTVREKFSFSVGVTPTEAEELVQKKEVSFSVTPPEVELKAPPGSIRTINLVFTNQESQPVRFRLRLKDIHIDSDGEIALLEKGSTSWSASNWVELKESEFQLGQGQRKNILGLLKIPKGVTGGRYTYLAVEASLASSKTDEKMMSFVPETFIAVTVGDNLERKGEISEFQFLQTNGDLPEFSVLFNNTGNVHLIVEGMIILEDSSGSTVTEIPFSEGRAFVLPEGSRRFTLSVGGDLLQAGEYKARVTFFSQNEALVSTIEEVVVTD